MACTLLTVLRDENRGRRYRSWEYVLSFTPDAGLRHIYIDGQHGTLDQGEAPRLTIACLHRSTGAAEPDRGSWARSPLQ